jgi:hypothetical protein
MGLLELAANTIALELAYIVDEELAFEMVYFVLDADGEDAVCFELERSACRIDRVD